MQVTFYYYDSEIRKYNGLSIWLGWKGKECIHNFGGGTCCKMFLWKTDEEVGR
jgi:hypothetical protein